MSKPLDEGAETVQRMTFPKGINIQEAAWMLVREARFRPVIGRFNERPIVAAPGSVVQDVVSQYWRATQGEHG